MSIASGAARPASRRGSVLAKTAWDVSLPALTGLAIVFISLLVLNGLGPVSPATVRKVEVALSRVRFALGGWSSVILWAGTFLLAGALFARNLKAAAGVKRVRAVLGFGQTVLLVLTTVVISGQVAVQQAPARAHKLLATEYHAALSDEMRAEREAATASAMRDALQSLIATHNQQLAVAVQAIQRTVETDHLDPSIVVALARADAPPTAPQPITPDKPIGSVATTSHELDRQLRTLTDQKLRTSRVQADAQAKVAIATAAAVQFVDSLPIPDTARTLVVALVGNLLDRSVPRFVDRVQGLESELKALKPAPLDGSGPVRSRSDSGLDELLRDAIDGRVGETPGRG